MLTLAVTLAAAAGHHGCQMAIMIAAVAAFAWLDLEPS
jgi:hypothetical protein